MLKTSGFSVVALGRSYLQYPMYSDSEGFALNFGGIIKFRSVVRCLATSTLLRSDETYSATVDLSQSSLENAFFGAHIRTEMDVVAGWLPKDWISSRYDTQAGYNLQQCPYQTLLLSTLHLAILLR